jgi:parvulin-like peptidyl-prolyl isomerase
MKAGIWLPIFIVALVAALCWKLSHDQSVDQLTASWRDLRFWNPQVSREEAVEALKKNQRVRQSRPTDLTADVTNTLQDEFDAWSRQFEKGESDRASRLTLQHLSEHKLKQSMRESLLDEAWLEKQLLEKAPPTTESEARTWFSEHVESLRIPDTHHVAHIFLSRHDPKKPDREVEIRTLHRKLTSGAASFAEVAAQQSEDSRSKALGGDLGWITTTRMPADFVQAVEKLPLGKISDPVQTKLGWHLIRVDERRSSRLPKFEEVKTEIIAMLDQQRREKALKELF